MIDCYFTKITQIFDYGWVLEDGAQRPRPTEVGFGMFFKGIHSLPLDNFRSIKIEKSRFNLRDV